ncbi:MAG: GNAT family N-acetyltransferase [Acidobacteriaceae bacterium]
MGLVDGVAIRCATEADVPALDALIEASVRGLQANDYTQAEIEGALGHALGLDSQLIKDRTYFIAEVGGEMVASGGWSYRATLFGSDGLPMREPGCLDPKKDAAKIRAIFVHPGWARRGLGSLMLEYCERQAQAAGFTRLEMGSTLTGAPLYRLRGYKDDERIAIPLPNGEALPVIRMSKNI